MSPQIAKIAPNLSTMVEEIFKYHSSQIAKIAPNLSTMFGEIFKYQSSQIAKFAPNLSTMVEEIFKYLEVINCRGHKKSRKSREIFRDFYGKSRGN